MQTAEKPSLAWHASEIPPREIWLIVILKTTPHKVKYRIEAWVIPSLVEIGYSMQRSGSKPEIPARSAFAVGYKSL